MEFNGTFLASIVTFIIFVLLMNKILYAPILNIIEARKNFIDKNYETAEKNNKKIEAIASDRENMLSTARETAKEKYNETVGEYKLQKQELVDEALKQSKEDIENSNNELLNITNEAKQELKNQMTDLANDIVEKVLGYRSNIENFNNEEVDKILYN